MTNYILRNIVDDYTSKNNDTPDVYILVVSCTLTKKQIQFFELYYSNHGFKKMNIWTDSIIGSILYYEYPDLLFMYFNINLLSDTWQMKAKRYDCLKLYLDNFNKSMKDLFDLSLDKFLCFNNLHKNIDYLFEAKKQ